MISLVQKALTLAVAAVTCAACFATTPGGEDASPPAGSNRPSAAPGGEESPAVDNGDNTLKFGDAYTWKDGVTVTVGKPKKFKPSEYSEIKKAKAHLRFRITIVNKSNGPIDLTLTYVTLQSSNKEAEQVFDSGNDLEGSPSTKLLKGRESEFDIGFGVADPKDLVMELALQDDFERDSLIFTN